jgi:orotate phosphoribosyltransferase
MSLIKDHIGELYYRSNSIKFDEKGEGFRLSAHLDNPSLAPSPYYLHYPKPGEPGYALMPEMIKYCGMALFKLAVDLGIDANKIAAVPSGADPIAEAMARYRPEFPNNLLRFEKHQRNSETSFTLRNGTFDEHEALTVIDDHTSGGRNKRLFQIAAEGYGLNVTHMLNIVDREQGAEAVMADHGIVMHSLFTITELFEYGVAERHITQDTYDNAMSYKQNNVIPTDR